MKICVLDGHTLNPGDLSWEPLRQLGDLTVFPRTSQNEVMDRADGCEILVVNKVVIDAGLISKLSRLKCIIVTATGYNNVDVAEAYRLGIKVCNAVGYGTDDVAQHVFAFILHFSNSICQHHADVRAGLWSSNPDFSLYRMSLVGLRDKTIGIYGMGKIGLRVGELADAFGMRVLYVHPRPVSALRSHFQRVDVDGLCRASDFISLNARLTDANFQIVNENFLNKMKATAVLINTSRGDLVNERDLALALTEDRIAAAYLDVLSLEPPPADHPLIQLNNCVVTSHMAWATREARQKLMDISVANVSAFLDGKPDNEVKPA